MKRNSAATESETMSYGPDTGVQLRCVEDMIRRRAYELFEARGRRRDHEVDDWLQAEGEVKHHLGLSI